MDKSGICHDELIVRAEKWLRGTMRCAITIPEAGLIGSERADVIGWKINGQSFLVECKATRSDFLTDKHKPWRRFPNIGMGMFRYYLTNPGIISPSELPEKWGLCEVHPKLVRVIVKPEPYLYSQHPGFWRERKLLIRLLSQIDEDNNHLDEL